MLSIPNRIVRTNGGLRSSNDNVFESARLATERDVLQSIAIKLHRPMPLVRTFAQHDSRVRLKREQSMVQLFDIGDSDDFAFGFRESWSVVR